MQCACAALSSESQPWTSTAVLSTQPLQSALPAASLHPRHPQVGGLAAAYSVSIQPTALPAVPGAGEETAPSLEKRRSWNLTFAALPGMEVSSREAGAKLQLLPFASSKREFCKYPKWCVLQTSDHKFLNGQVVMGNHVPGM